MSNSTQTFDPIVQSQASKEITANAFFDAVSQSSAYGRRASTCSGLTWGYYGGNITVTASTMSQIANGTVALTASTTNYLVALKSSGAVSVSTATTNWNDTTNYWRLYSIVTGTTTVSSYIDSRQEALYQGADPTNTQTLVGKTLTNPTINADSGTLILPQNTTPAQTAEGSIVWDTDTDVLTVGDGTSRKTMLDIESAQTATGTKTFDVAVISQLRLNAPVTKTGDFTVGATENVIICNGTATINITMPTASSFTGRIIRIKTIAAYTVVSVASNIVPINSATAGTAILAATAGKYVELISDGTSWITMQAN